MNNNFSPKCALCRHFWRGVQCAHGQRGVQTTPTQACRFPARKLRSRTSWQEEDFPPRPLSILSQWKDLLKALDFILVNDQPGHTHIMYCDRKLGIHCAQEEHLWGEEVCKLLPLKLAGSQQECFAQEEDMIHPRGIQLASLGVQNQSSSGEKALNRSGRCWGSQVPEHEFQCNYRDNFLCKPGQGKTLPLCQCHQGNTSRAFRNQRSLHLFPPCEAFHIL